MAKITSPVPIMCLLALTFSESLQQTGAVYVRSTLGSIVIFSLFTTQHNKCHFFQMYLVFNLTLRLGICLPLKGTHFQTPSGVTEWNKYSGELDEGGGQETRISFLAVSLNVELPSSEPNCPMCDTT